MGQETIIHVFDVFLTCFIFFPVMVLYWRGIWDLWGVYIYPNDHPKQEWVLFGITSITILGYFLMPLLDQKLESTKEKYKYVIITRLYMCVYGALFMGYWRALWTLSDYYVPNNLIGSVVNFICGYVVVLLLRGSRCTILPPMYATLDTRGDLLKVATRFGTQPYSFKYFFDCMFSHFVIISITIIGWRGAWNVFKYSIYPDDFLLSTRICLIAGYILTLIIFALEKPLAIITLKMAQKGFYYKLIWEDAVYTIIHICNVCLWRGSWNTVALYILPDPEYGGWVCFLTGMVGLLLMQLFTYASAHGVLVDGNDPGRAAFFPIKFLRVYLKDYSCFKEKSHHISKEKETEAKEDKYTMKLENE